MAAETVFSSPLESLYTILLVRAPRWPLSVVVLGCAISVLAAAPDAASVSGRARFRSRLYAEDAPNPNPPFDLFSFGRFNYPYPMRDGLTMRRETVSWRSLHLENEYLRVTVLPDLGGHLYSCLDKRTGREMFYANTAIKKALIGYRGAWAALGIEFNFPVSHNWVSVSPVDFAVATECRWERIDLDRKHGSGLRLAVARRIAPQARSGRPRRARRAVQLERCAAPLLLVDQRRGAGRGRTRGSSIRPS